MPNPGPRHAGSGLFASARGGHTCDGAAARGKRTPVCLSGGPPASSHEQPSQWVQSQRQTEKKVVGDCRSGRQRRCCCFEGELARLPGSAHAVALACILAVVCCPVFAVKGSVRLFQSTGSFGVDQCQAIAQFSSMVIPPSQR